MRVSRLAVCLLMCLFGSGVIACSGSDQRTIPIDAPPPPPDTPSNPPPDAGVTCAQQGTLNATTALDFSTAGQVQGGVPANGTELTVAVIVTTNAARTMGFIIGQRNNTGVFATATGKAGRLEKPPATGLYAMDTDASFGFGIDFVDGITVNPDSTTTSTAESSAATTRAPTTRTAPSSPATGRAAGARTSVCRFSAFLRSEAKSFCQAQIESEVVGTGQEVDWDQNVRRGGGWVVVADRSQ